jgi:hypothetical protein
LGGEDQKTSFELRMVYMEYHYQLYEKWEASVVPSPTDDSLSFVIEKLCALQNSKSDIGHY